MAHPSNNIIIYWKMDFFKECLCRGLACLFMEWWFESFTLNAKKSLKKGTIPSEAAAKKSLSKFVYIHRIDSVENLVYCKYDFSSFNNFLYNDWILKCYVSIFSHAIFLSEGRDLNIIIKSTEHNLGSLKPQKFMRDVVQKVKQL